MAKCLKASSIDDRDEAGVQLIRRYAQLLDDARGLENEVEVYNDLGPKLLTALTVLGLTLAGRRKEGVSVAAGPGKLDELRQRRSRRSG